MSELNLYKSEITSPQIHPWGYSEFWAIAKLISCTILNEVR